MVCFVSIREVNSELVRRETHVLVTFSCSCTEHVNDFVKKISSSVKVKRVIPFAEMVRELRLTGRIADIRHVGAIVVVCRGNNELGHIVEILRLVFKGALYAVEGTEVEDGTGEDSAGQRQEAGSASGDTFGHVMVADAQDKTVAGCLGLKGALSGGTALGAGGLADGQVATAGMASAETKAVASALPVVGSSGVILGAAVMPVVPVICAVAHGVYKLQAWFDKRGRPHSLCGGGSSSSRTGQPFSNFRYDEALVVPRPNGNGIGEAEQVGFAVVAPSKVKSGDHLLLQIVGSQIEMLNEIIEDSEAEDKDNDAVCRGKLKAKVLRGQRLSFRFQSAELVADEPDAEVIWEGESFNLRIDVLVPENCRKGTVVSQVRIFVEGFPIGKILFSTNVVGERRYVNRDDPARTVAEASRYFFMSYADFDAKRVTEFVEGVQLGAKCDDSHIFFARNSIGKGEDWFASICEFLDNKADELVLFWTTHSAESPNVRDEYERAIANGLPITPIIFSRPYPTPPEMLRKYSFTDRYAYMK